MRRTAPAAAVLVSCFGLAQAAELTDLSFEQLLDTTVTGASKYEQKQSEVAAAVSVITRAEIEAFGWRSLAEALSSLPGIYTTYDRQYSYVGTRGFSAPGDYNTRMLLTVDGNRVNDAVFDQAFVGNEFSLDMDLIERIEYIPGPGGAVYGSNALLGVINVVTRSGASMNGAELSASYQDPQMTRRGRASWGGTLSNGVDVLASVSGMNAEGEDLFVDFGPAGVSGRANGLDGERDREAFGSLSAGPWTVRASYGDRRKDDPLGTYLSDPLTRGQYQRDRQLLAQLGYEDRYAADTLRLSGRLFMGRQRYTAPFVYTGSPTRNPTSSDWYGAEAQLLSTAYAGHTLMAGVEYQANTRLDQDFVDLVDPANTSRVHGSGWRAGVYAQDDWALGKALSVTLGMRVDRNDVSGTAVSPRVGLIWHAAPDAVWKLLYGRAHRAPNAYESEFTATFLDPNPSLRKETVDTLELVTDHRLGNDLSLRASVYYWTMQNLVTLETNPLTGNPQYQNCDDITTYGGELSATKVWEGGTRLRTSVSYQHARDIDNRRLSNSPSLLGKLNLSIPLLDTGLRLGYEMQYGSHREAIDGSRIGGYWLSNLNVVAADWVQGVTVSAGIYNLWDADYAQPGSDNNWQTRLAQDGRSARLRVDYRF
ncbi:MAG: TonB-dependent receptor plug domain-containing protein [Immundisolibacter sp.]|uniref:TonB-dependent receptor plug domain-containing protein n=1 Tax=Immundisolibacter sp. TaxID=1934948 RepID=UPI003D14C8F1